MHRCRGCRDSTLGNLTGYFGSLPLLLILFMLLSSGARELSLTFDEPSHLAAGYTFLARWDTWVISWRGHPLLVDAWEALPVYVATPDIPLERLEGWHQDYLRYVESFASFWGQALERCAFAGRIQAMLLAVLFGSVVYRWGADVNKKWVAPLALGLLVFDPTLLAHGRLLTNDAGAVALGTLGLYLVRRWELRPTWRRSFIAGVLLGLTTLAKSPGILWAIAGLSWMLWVSLRHRGKRTFLLFQTLVTGVVAFVVLWGMYGFEVGMIPGQFSIPVPASRHWTGLFVHAAPGTESSGIVLGKLRSGSWPWLLPMAFLVKNPLPLLVALIIALVALRHTYQDSHTFQVLGWFSLFYLLVAIPRGLSMGYRHMLPIHPLLYLLVASGIRRVWQHLPRVGRGAILALGLWYIAGTMRVYPYEVAFFNELAGGPSNGWRFLAESNTDWGQAWKALRTFREQRALKFSYSGLEGYAGTAPYDLWDRPLPPLRHTSEPIFKPWLFPEPGDYVISANTLTGSWLVNPDNFSWFRYHRPDAIVAYVLYYYHVDAARAPSWLAQCTVPVAPLDDRAIAEGSGNLTLRTVAFDCTQSWLYPEGGITRGAYVLHGEALQPASLWERLYLAPARPLDSFAGRHLRGLPLGCRQWEHRSLPAFALYEWEDSLHLESLLPGALVAAPDTYPGALTGGKSHTAPIQLDGPLAFLGVAAYPQKDVLEVETWWQVTEWPITRLFSIMGHLLADDGTVLGIADGLGISPLVMKAGDVIVQRHRFPAPERSTRVWLRTGAYWLDTETDARWPIADVAGDNVLFIPLGEW